MLDDKYYTPSIEEFHVGFEYEYKFVIANNYNNLVKKHNTG